MKVRWIDLATHKEMGQADEENITDGSILVMADKKLTMYLYRSDKNVYVDLLTQDYIIQDVQERKIWGMYGFSNLSLINYHTSPYYQQ